ncbi:MAG: hypothetical protein K2Q13_10395 [Nitrosomonas sp.]|nr:hypothetical protein [Nitrosomonas sp.]MBY0475451.1 hypothetical protein [Nitrosomonas sp.]
MIKQILFVLIELFSAPNNQNQRDTDYEDFMLSVSTNDSDRGRDWI